MTASRIAAATPLLALAIGLAAAPALAARINTGEATGAYHTDFCPALARELAKSRFEHACTPTAGPAETLKRIAAEPRELGYSPLDAFALEAPAHGGEKAFLRVRGDEVRECIFAVTRNAELKSLGELQANAHRLRFILPPEGSASALTFKSLQRIDEKGLGRAGTVVNAADIDEAIQLSLSAEDTVALFLHFPDPASPHFATVDRLEGRVLPVLDRAILSHRAGDQKVYFAQETEIGGAWLSAGTRLVTACTPLVVVTGHPDRVPAGPARQEHADLIATIRAIRSESLFPPEDAVARVMRRTREISGQAADRLAALIEEARAKAKPLIGKAEEAIAAARPAWEKARELSRRVYEKAREEAREIAKELEDLVRKAPGAPAPKE
jgi:hypothetical protein